MAKKVFSTLTGKCYDTDEEFELAEKEYQAALEEAEAKRKAKDNERKELADKVEAALANYTKVKEAYTKEVNKAYNDYKTALSEFCTKYGYFHTSFNDSTVDTLFKMFF